MFGNDILSSLYCLVNVGNLSLYKLLCCQFRIILTLKHDDLCQWLQSTFACNLRTSPSFWFEWQVDIFQFGTIPAVIDTLLEFGSHLLLFGDGLTDSLLALLHLLQPVVQVADVRNLYLVEIACALLTIARDEGNGTTLFEQSQCVLDTLLMKVEPLGYEFGELVHGS